MVAGLLSLLAVDFLQLLIPMVIKRAIDALTLGKATSTLLLQSGGMIMAIAFTMASLRYVWRYCLFGLSRKIAEGIRNRLYEHIQTLSVSFYHRTKTGDLMARADQRYQCGSHGDRHGDSFNLRGMTYTYSGLVDKELNDETWTVFKDMVGQSAYSPQAYRTLAQSLIEKGHPEWAADLELSGKRREKNQILKPSPWEHLLKPPYYGPWLCSWFLDIFSGYGQRPQFAFGWSLLVVVIGSFVFRKEKDMVVLVESKAIPPYNPLLYSFALFLPYIDLEIASKWDPKPERKYAGIYKHIHRLLGWILMPIALLTFGGIIV